VTAPPPGVAPLIRRLGVCDYVATFDAMRALTDARDATSPDELWLLEHHPVFTQGQAGRAEHLLMPGAIPVIQSDRGGQVTYHGPGQLVAYVLVDLNRLGYGVRSLVTRIENAMVATLAQYGIIAHARADAPGVYVGARKIGSLGLRVRHGYSYHGLSLNVGMDLEPFSRINPCGHEGLAMTQVADLGGPSEVDVIAETLAPLLLQALHPSTVTCPSSEASMSPESFAVDRGPR